MNFDLQVQKNPDHAVWFDVGVFKTLFCEVSHYFLPAESDQVASAVSSRTANSKEVKSLYTVDVSLDSLKEIFGGFTQFLSFSVRRSCPALWTIRAGKSRS